MLDYFKPKMIAFDIDGTILNDKGELTPRTLSALRRAMASGVKLVCATGRMYPSALPILRRIGITSPSVILNGAQIRNPVTHEVVYERTLGRELTRAMLDFYRGNGWYIQIYHDDRLLVPDDGDERCKYYESISKVKAVPLGGDFWNFDGASAKMLGISFDPDTYKIMFNKTNEVFAGKIYSAASQGRFIEFVHPEVNKARSLALAAELSGVDRRDVLAFGDGDNDREMLAWAGVGAAMGNARDGVRELADIVVPDNNNDGVAAAIENFLDRGRP